MKLTPEELEAQGYRLVDRLNHQEIVPFVQKGLKLKNRYSRAYVLLNLLIIAVIGLQLFLAWMSGTVLISDALTWTSYGVAMAFGLIPLHEYIHVLAYRYVGAEHTSYDANLRKFYFMAIADRFVADFRSFRVVALAPFVVITVSLLIAYFLVSGLWQFSVLAILLTHTACCSGDFGLLAYMCSNRYRDMVTYDDKENQTSYFYAK
ncbi:MAG: DUF3267 domain-containing protein [Flavobacteriales bacterium]|nr:DUF3267 domain-containing protein [Flavobacteriales bacterium]